MNDGRTMCYIRSGLGMKRKYCTRFRNNIASLLSIYFMQPANMVKEKVFDLHCQIERQLDAKPASVTGTGASGSSCS
jgi:hypothetical protein